MSSRATAWAWEQQVKPSSAKLLLVALADNANAYTGLAFPSIDQLIYMTGQDRKTVISGIARLIEMELMKDTGRRTGKTGQIPVYKLAVTGDAKPSQKRDAKRVPKTDGNSTVFPTKESQKRDTEPSKEPNKEEDSNHYEPGVVETDLFGAPVKSPEQLEAEHRAEIIRKIEEGWGALAAAVPAVAPLRGGSLDDARAGSALAVAKKFVTDGETEEDVWKAIFDQIGRSSWLCGEVASSGRAPFRLQMTWLLENRNFTKVLEGKFDDGRDPTVPGGGAPARVSPAGQVALGVLERNRARRQRGAGAGSRGVAHG